MLENVTQDKVCKNKRLGETILVLEEICSRSPRFFLDRHFEVVPRLFRGVAKIRLMIVWFEISSYLSVFPQFRILMRGGRSAS